jgi:hypothetical protein
LIEGVASYVSTRTLPEEDRSVQCSQQNGGGGGGSGGSETVRPDGHDESPSSTDSGFASLNCRQNDVDPIDAKITEIFESIESVSVPETEYVRIVRRRRSEPDKSGFFQRRKQTVSGYFSDWAKWITNVETEGDPYLG